jgi:GAF domain-containing protein
VASERLVDTLRELAEVLQREQALGIALARIAATATRSVPGCAAATVALSVAGRPATAAISGFIALELDMVQYDSDGPCIESFRTGQTIRLDLVEQGEAFPHFAQSARQHEIRGVLSLPARWGGEVIATLNLYNHEGQFDETAETVGRVLAAQVAIAVSRSPEYTAARGVVEQAQRDADDQAEISLATGLLMSYEECTAEQAEGLIQEAADHDEQTLLEIAHRIIDQHRNAQ